MELIKYFKEGHNTSDEYISANVVKDLPLINIRFS